MMSKYDDLAAVVIDDSRFVREYVSAALKHIGLRKVESYENGGTALVEIQNNIERYQLVICDLNMPGIDGVAMMRWLAEYNYLGGIVLISGENEKILQTVAKVARANRLNVLGALPKPVNQEALAGMVQSFHEQRGKKEKLRPRHEFSADEVKHAIFNDQIVLHFQPQIEMGNGTVAGAETLVRWQHPEHGLIYPGDFIEIAERDSLIHDLTYVVIRKSFEQMQRWRHRFNGIISINVSVQTLRILELPELICAAAADHDVPLSKVTIEVTESRLIDDIATSLEVLSRLCLRGMRLSIDDFGTGYSSLEQLKMIPFEELKIDRTFVHNSAQDQESQAILKSSIQLANSLGLRVVAEGIETKDDWNTTSLLGCHIGQGYYLQRPLPADQFISWVNDWGYSRQKWAWRGQEELSEQAPRQKKKAVS